jgi:FtsP/CotA-like multicopper oxidase with cupredoxin domain
MDGTQTGESSMVFGNELATEPQASLSRRELLRRGALAGASLYPGISLFSATAQGDSSAGSSIAEYELNVAAREARPDGRNRQIWCYNGQLPGPLIRAKLGQKLRIKVVNHLPVATSVHWHGLH